MHSDQGIKGNPAAHRMFDQMIFSAYCFSSLISIELFTAFVLSTSRLTTIVRKAVKNECPLPDCDKQVLWLKDHLKRVHNNWDEGKAKDTVSQFQRRTKTTLTAQ